MVSTRSAIDVLSCAWILVHGIAIGICSFVELIDQFHSCTVDSKRPVLSEMILQRLSQLVLHREVVLCLLQERVRQKRRGRGSSALRSKVQAEAFGIYSSIRTLWQWLRYEARHHSGVLRFLMDVYIDIKDTEDSIGAKSAVTSIMCLALGVEEDREYLEPFRRRHLTNCRRTLNAWPITDSLRDSVRHIDLYSTVSGLPAFTDKSFLGLLAQSSFWSGVMRDFQAQPSGRSSASVTVSDRRALLAVLLHQLYKCLHASTSASKQKTCGILYTNSTFELFLVNYSMQDDSNLAMLSLDVLDWIVHANRDRVSSSSDDANEQSFEKMSVSLVRASFTMAILGVIPRQSIITRRYATNVHSPVPTFAAAIAAAARVPSSTASSRAKPLLKLLKATGCDTGARWRTKGFRGDGRNAYVHHALASIHTKLRPERFMEFAHLFFCDAFLFVHQFVDSVSSKTSPTRRTAPLRKDVHPTLRMLSMNTATFQMGHIFDLLLTTIVSPRCPCASLDPPKSLIMFNNSTPDVNDSPYSWLLRWIATVHSFVGECLLHITNSTARHSRSNARQGGRRKRHKRGTTGPKSSARTKRSAHNQGHESSQPFDDLSGADSQSESETNVSSDSSNDDSSDDSTGFERDGGASDSDESDDEPQSPRNGRTRGHSKARTSRPRAQAGMVEVTNVVVSCIEHILSRITALFPALEVRLDDCIVWRATCRPTESVASHHSQGQKLELEPLGHLLRVCNNLRQSMTSLCQEVKSKVRVQVSTQHLQKVPVCNSTLETFGLTLRAIASENHIDVDWDHSQDHPPTFSRDIKERDFVHRWLPTLFELEPFDVVNGRGESDLEDESDDSSTDDEESSSDEESGGNF